MSMTSTQITVLIIILLYMAITVAIGIFVRMRQRKKKETSNEDFLLASKSLGPFVLAGTLFAANTGGASTLGIANNVSIYGMSASWYVIAAGIGFVLVSFIAPYFRRASASTVPQIINMRYGKASHIFTAITSITALFMATGAQIIATATIINVLSDFDFTAAAIITTVVVIAYTMSGGYKSVTAANLMHLLSITVGMGVALVVMVSGKEIGGFANLFDKARAATDASGANMDLLSMTKIGLPVILGYIAMYFMTFPTGQEIVQTYCSAKTGAAAKSGSIIAGLISAVFAFIPALIGVIAFAFPPTELAKGVELSKSALASATLAYAPPIIAGIVLAAIVAATMSSASGNMIGTATMFTKDLYVPYIKKGKADDKTEILITRITMVVVGVVGLFIALTASNIISVMMGAFALRSAGPFAAFIFGVFVKYVTKRAGFISIAVGTVVAAYWIYGLNTPWGLSAIVPGGIAAFAAIIIVSAIDKSLGKPPAPPIPFDAE